MAHLRLASTDPAEAEPSIRSVFPAMRLSIDVPDPDPPYRFLHEADGDDELAVHRIRMSQGGRATGNVGGAMVIGFAAGSDGGMWSRTESVDLSRPYRAPDVDHDAAWSHFDAELIVLAAHLVDDAARALTGRGGPSPRFRGTAPLGGAAVAYWQSLRDHVRLVCSTPELLGSPLIRGETIRTVARSALLTFPTDLGHDLLEVPARDRAARRAGEYLRDHADRDVSIEEAAAHAGVGVRMLVPAFRDVHGVTPLRFLRDVRLERARRDLLDEDPWRTTVAVVARRWGFAHLGRFAAGYRERFGETPSRTLHG